MTNAKKAADEGKYNSISLRMQSLVKARDELEKEIKRRKKVGENTYSLIRSLRAYDLDIKGYRKTLDKWKK